jgi:hypothetical protein
MTTLNRTARRHRLDVDAETFALITRLARVNDMPWGQFLAQTIFACRSICVGENPSLHFQICSLGNSEGQ